MTIKDYIKDRLLNGDHINKFDLLHNTGSVCLAQRVEEIRNDDLWDVRSKSIKGKGNLVEYWLEPEEIRRIKTPQQTPLGLFGEL